MYSDDTRMGEGDRWLPQKYGLGKDTGENAVNNGEQMWDKLVSKYPNILFVFSGHVLNGGVGTLVSIGEQGNKVYQMLANFQDGVKGTNRGQTGFFTYCRYRCEKETGKSGHLFSLFERI